MNSLKRILLDHWKSKDEWINGADGEKIAMYEGYKPSNAGRRLRELCQEGILNRQLRPMRSGGKSVWYIYAKNEIKKEIQANYNQTPRLDMGRMQEDNQGEIQQLMLHLS